jgi:uncharacterized membrane protein HdeD (DUF308 family)
VIRGQTRFAFSDSCLFAPKAFGVASFVRANAPQLPQERIMNITKNVGMLLLAIYLIIVGIVALFHIGIPSIVTGILALVAGILILIGR